MGKYGTTTTIHTEGAVNGSFLCILRWCELDWTLQNLFRGFWTVHWLIETPHGSEVFHLAFEMPRLKLMTRLQIVTVHLNTVKCALKTAQTSNKYL